MNKNNGHKQEKRETRREGEFARPDLGDQLKGAAIGGVIALALSYVAQELGLIQGRLIQYTLWGGAIGGLFGASDELARAGARLTKRDAKWLNILVAIVGFLAIFAVLVGVVSLAAWIVNTVLRPGAGMPL